MTERLVENAKLSAKGFLNTIRDVFSKIKEPPKGAQGTPKTITIVDCLMSALAVFKLKFPSLLQFDESKAETPIKENLENLFGLVEIPCDTYMRERLDEIDPKDLRKAFTTVFSSLQRGKVLEKYVYLDGKYLLLSDGTGFFSSKTIHCKNCCEKHHKKDGSVTYYHQMLCGVLAHPDFKEVIPLCPEPIKKEDGAKKNDCERNASERFLRDFRREHPHLPVILVEDALSANGPHLRLLKDLNISHITVVKPDGNAFLFDWVNSVQADSGQENFVEEFTFVEKRKIEKETQEEEIKEKNASDRDKKRRIRKKRKEQTANKKLEIEEHKLFTHKFRYVNGVPLNDANSDLKVNFIEYWEFDEAGNQLYHNTWITDIPITIANVYTIAKGGRARWHIENETFNTLKNQDYHFEHNFGHGYKNLSTVFGLLMMLAFLIDQAEQICCSLFQNALKTLKCKKSRLWRRVREYFVSYIILSWESLYLAIIAGNSRDFPILDTT